MTRRFFLPTASTLFVALTLNLQGAAEPARPAATKAPTSTSPRATTGKAGARGPLPDPTLLDGATHPVEKKSEHGMIGDFELPGDENVRNGKVGGPQNPLQLPMPSAGGLPSLPTAGGATPPGLPQSGKQGGGPEGPQNPNAAGQSAEGAGQQGGQPQGTQVAQLGGEPSGESPAGTGEKPQPVAIGDSAMRIPATPSAAGVVGGQQQIQGNTQHHEKGTGSGGKGPAAGQGNNKVERGRSIPAGL